MIKIFYILVSNSKCLKGAKAKRYETKLLNIGSFWKSKFLLPSEDGDGIILKIYLIEKCTYYIATYISPQVWAGKWRWRKN